MSTCAVLSFRLGGTDGVSIVADTWINALHSLGFEVTTVAGEGEADVLIADLAIGRWPDGVAGLHGEQAATADEIRRLSAEVRAALDGVDLVIVENLGSIPLNLPASLAVAQARVGLPTIWHHHDPAWQRDRYTNVTELPPVEEPDSHQWRHVTINDLTRLQFLERGIAATTIRNGFDVHAQLGNRRRERDRLGFEAAELVMVHPVRAIERKNIPQALEIAQSIGATYWITGPAEEGYTPVLHVLLDDARAAGLNVVHEPSSSLADMYAASDVVVFPSTWEGFGNPPIDAAIHRRPAIVGHYPVAEELRALGFHWFDSEDLTEYRQWLTDPDQQLVDRNFRIAESALSLEVMQTALATLLDEAGWLP
ncbi:MAG: glycosyltransferase family 4 protein [Acidimicrobiales bacterium]